MRARQGSGAARVRTGFAREGKPSKVRLISMSDAPQKPGLPKLTLIGVGGLLIVPLCGLVYATTTSFDALEGSAKAPKSAKPPAIGSPEEDGGSAETDPDEAPIGQAKSPRSARKQRTDEAAECCEALRGLAKTAEVKLRGNYLSASNACETTKDAENAKKRVASQLKVAKAELPAVCEPK